MIKEFSKLVSVDVFGFQPTVEVFFFKLDRTVGDVELEREYHARGLFPAGLWLLQFANKDRSFTERHPNLSHSLCKDRGLWYTFEFNNGYYYGYRVWSKAGVVVGSEAWGGHLSQDYGPGTWFAGTKERCPSFSARQKEEWVAERY